MTGILSFTKRNIQCFFRDPLSVVFSLLAVLIVIMLYLFFLRNTLVDGYSASITWVSYDEVGHLVDSWVLAGILGIVAVTTSAGSLQTMMEDKVMKKNRDFTVTPVSSAGLAWGYILSTFLVGMIMSIVALAISLAYLYLTGCKLDVESIYMCVVLLIPAALSGSIIVYVLTSFLKSNGAFSGFFTVISVLIGFLTGIYMPMGTMNTVMQTIGTLVPASHMVALFRNNLCSGEMDLIFGSYPSEDFRKEMGFDLYLGDYQFTNETMLLYVCVVTAAFFVISLILMRRK